eukprot:1178960-Prorocentrum_minimum.AAC.1
MLAHMPQVSHCGAHTLSHARKHAQQPHHSRSCLAVAHPRLGGGHAQHLLILFAAHVRTGRRLAEHCVCCTCLDGVAKGGACAMHVKGAHTARLGGGRLQRTLDGDLLGGPVGRGEGAGAAVLVDCAAHYTCCARALRCR